MSKRRGAHVVGLLVAVLALVVGAAPGAGAQVGGPDPAAVRDGRVGRVERSEAPVAGQYIVTLRPSGSPVPEVADSLARSHGGTVLRTYTHALSGFSVSMSDAEALALSTDPAVESVAQDGYVHASSVQAPTPSWGLDRIDQHPLPLDSSYTYNADGTGVTAYIIDTGIRITHADFGGRASVGVDKIGDGQNGNDCHGHGTHVAGTVGGTQYGVAKNVSLVAVRVLDCQGSGTNAGVIAGVDWVTANHPSPAVANMSLGGGISTALDTAVENSIASGVTYAIAAGNGGNDSIGDDACQSSPARAPSALTVAATDSADTRTVWSNYGTCVDLFAPGLNIASDWNSSNSATNTISGTSMATPHVAGAAALYLHANPTATPAQVASALTTAASPGVVTNPGTGSPNRLVYEDFVGAAPGPGVPAGGVVNGGFETEGLSGWTKALLGTTSVTGPAHNGTAYAAKVGPTPTRSYFYDASITQTFSVPSGATTLSFWYQSWCGDSSKDWASATLRDNTTGTTTTVLDKKCTAPAAPPWKQVLLPGAVIPGHSYTLTLANHDSTAFSSLPTYTLYDDVTIG